MQRRARKTREEERERIGSVEEGGGMEMAMGEEGWLGYTDSKRGWGWGGVVLHFCPHNVHTVQPAPIHSYQQTQFHEQTHTTKQQRVLNSPLLCSNCLKYQTMHSHGAI